MIDERPRNTVQHLYEVMLSQQRTEPLLALVRWLSDTVATGARQVCGNEKRLRHSMLSLLGAAPEGSSYQQHWHKVRPVLQCTCRYSGMRVLLAS